MGMQTLITIIFLKRGRDHYYDLVQMLNFMAEGYRSNLPKLAYIVGGRGKTHS